VHRVADRIEEALSVPFLHIADPTAQAIEVRGISTVGLLGTRFTMEGDFISGRLRAQGVRCIVPPPGDRAVVHRVIYEELCAGKVVESSRQRFLAIIRDLIAHGAQGVVLGCTEIPLLISPKDLEVPVLDTMDLHARAAVELSLA
jgi:aspartate racemase